MAESKNRNILLLWGITLSAILGAWLRFWDWPHQILLNDEWHSLNYVTDKSFADVVLRPVGVGANSIPENIYSWLTLHTVGWSEVSLRLPSMLTGLLALVILPLLVSRLWGRLTAYATAVLLSTSPVLVFYSRIARPYSATMLLGSTSILLTLLWAQYGRRRDLLLSAVFATSAVYYHSASIIPVFIPFAIMLLIASAGNRISISLASPSPFKDLAIAAIIIITLSSVFVIPSIVNPAWLSGTVIGTDRATMITAYNALGIVSGTHHPVLRSLFLILTIFGLACMYRQTRIAGISVLTAISTYVLLIASVHMTTIYEAIQVVRYGIAFVPIFYIAVSLALTKLACIVTSSFSQPWHKRVVVFMMLAMWLPFVVKSHLREIFLSPNNFTNHCSYQNLYEPVSWEDMRKRDLFLNFPREYSEFPLLYSDSKAMQKVTGIIEYPMMVGDPFNVYFQYQHIHQKPVVAGYVTTGDFERIPSDNSYVIGNNTIDYVMEAISPTLRTKNRWRTMVDLEDSSLLKLKFKGWLIVVHKNPANELFQNSFPDYPLAAKVIQNMTRNFGVPAVSEKNALAWIVQ